MACLEAYLAVTKDLRGSSSPALFLSLKRPHRPIGSSTLGRWVKACLSDAGLDPSSFSAHSVRGAAASKAVKQGVPIESVLRAAHWSRASTFRKFYFRDFDPISVADTVLTQTSSD